MKKHIRRLHQTVFDFDYERDSQKVALSIPMFSSKQGNTAYYNADGSFNIEMYEAIICKGAVWTANSILKNTDLCDNGTPIFFHVEDVLYETTLDILTGYGVPEEWLRKTTFRDPVNIMPCIRYGKKFGAFSDTIDTDVFVIWDADAFVYRHPTDAKIQLYHHFETDLSEVPCFSYYSNWDKGLESYSNWLLRGVGESQGHVNPTKQELDDNLIKAYTKAELPLPAVRHRFGMGIFSVPKKHELFDFLKGWQHDSYNEEALASMWMNSKGSNFRHFEQVSGIPFYVTDADFFNNIRTCIAHPEGSDAYMLDRYFKRFLTGIQGETLTQFTGYTPTPRSKKRFHILSVPHNPTSKEYTSCAFAQKARKLCLMMHRLGHEVYHYGNELSEVECTEHVTVTTKYDLEQCYDFKNHNRIYTWDNNDYVYQTFHLRAEHEIRKRAQEDDVICYVFGRPLRPIYDKIQDLNVHHVESGIGYLETFCENLVFESYSKMHFNYGIYQERFDRWERLSDEERQKTWVDFKTANRYTNPRWQDAVIPNSFDVEDFLYKTEKKDYFLFIGRVIRNKGIEEAMRIAHTCGKKLIVAGPGCEDFEEEFGWEAWDNVELFGTADVEQRKELMANAIAGFCLSKYLDPFCGTHIEFALSGTPVIATDFGAFVDTLIHGVTGYRVRSYEQGVWAARNIHNIKPEACRQWGLNFSNESVALMYDEYFDSLIRYNHNKDTNFWYTNESRTDLDWLYRNPPAIKGGEK